MRRRWRCAIEAKDDAVGQQLGDYQADDIALAGPRRHLDFQPPPGDGEEHAVSLGAHGEHFGQQALPHAQCEWAEGREIDVAQRGADDGVGSLGSQLRGQRKARTTTRVS